MITWVYKRSHDDDPDRKTGIFGNRDCGMTHRGRKYDAVIGIWGATNWDGDRSRAFTLSWIGKGIHRLILNKETIDALSDVVFPEWNRNWKGAHILAFEHFKYYKDGYNLNEANNLVNRMQRVRTGGMMSPNLSEDAQRDVETILKLADNAGESPYLGKLNKIKYLQDASGISVVADVACLLDIHLTIASDTACCIGKCGSDRPPQKE